MSINHCLLNLLKICWVLQFVSSFVLAAQLSIVSPPLFHNLPPRYPAQDRDGALESSHWFTSCRKSWRDQAGKRRDRGPITYTAHLREWTWWQPPPPRSQLCSSSGRPALSGCWGSVASHWRWTSPGTCRKRCLLSWSTAPAGVTFRDSWANNKCAKIYFQHVLQLHFILRCPCYSVVVELTKIT